jgi:DNA invertase Pin-like site-specific DNA recombinase
VAAGDAADLQHQVDALNRLGVDPDHIYIDEGFTGAADNRSALDAALAACRPSGTLVVPTLDRLGSTELIVDVFRTATTLGLTLQAGAKRHTPPVVATTLELLEQLVDAGGRWNAHRTREAMATPSVRSKLQGRSPKLTPDQLADLADQHARGAAISALANAFQVDRSTVYRALNRKRHRPLPTTEAPLGAQDSEELQ